MIRRKLAAAWIALLFSCSLAGGCSKNGTGNIAAEQHGNAAGRRPTPGPHTILAPPSANWFPFEPAGSITNKPLPPDVLRHCYGDSDDCSAGDAIAKFALTNDGAVTPPYEREGETLGAVYFPDTYPNGNSSDVGIPLYYGQASDPWYKITGCLYDQQLKVTFHAPNQALFGALPGNDQHIGIYDVAQGIVVQAYGFNAQGLVVPNASSCPGTGPSKCAVQIPNLSGCAAERVGVDSDLQTQHYTARIRGNTHTLGGTSPTAEFSAWGGILRQNELMAGSVNHALLLGVYCTAPKKYVFPATSPLNACSTNPAGAPPAGALLFCDYTPAQISAMKTAGQISAPQATLLTTFCTYGGYITQTGGDSWAGLKLASSGGFESQTSYQRYYKIPDPIEAWGCSQGMNDFGQAGCRNGVLKSTYGPSLNVLGSIPLQLGPEGSDTSGRSCRTGRGCDVSGHIHLADPCVAMALAGMKDACSPGSSSKAR